MVQIDEKKVIKAAEEGMDAFLDVFVQAIYHDIGGELNATTMERLNADQITLLAYHILREEVMDGGFVQLIHNGYGPFIFKNPFAKAVREWGMDELAALINKGRSYYQKYGSQIEANAMKKSLWLCLRSIPTLTIWTTSLWNTKKNGLSKWPTI